MKILILTDRLDVGGAETHIAELALGLMRLGDTVELLSAGGKTAERLANSGIPHIYLDLCTHNPFRLLSQRKQLRRIIERGNYDVLHAHARIPALLLRGIKVKNACKIVTVHARFSHNPLLRWLCYWGERTIAVSEDLRSYVCDCYGVSGDTVRVIANGVDCDTFTPCVTEDSKIHLLFASRLDGDCVLGARLLCELAPALCRAFPNLEIGIAGGGDACSEIRDSANGINRLFRCERIKIHGPIEDMASLLAKQDIFIGVSRVAMEAAACGCAVILCGDEGYLGILSQENATDAMLSNFCCRGYPKAKKSDLERDLRLLLRDRTLCRSLGKDAREIIRSNCNAKTMCIQTRVLYARATHPPFRGRVLVGGYFGCGNLGDDAILLGFSEGMHTVSPDTEIYALTASPRRTKRRFCVPCIERKNPFAIRRAMKGSDLFICGGGSLLQNATSDRSLRYYLSLLRMAKRAGCKTALYAAGIGPICGDKAKKRVARVLGDCDYISLRDPDSMRFLIDLGVDRTKLHEGADPALLLPTPPPTRTAALLWEHGLPDRTAKCCIILRQLPQNALHLWKSVATATHLFCKRHGQIPVFLLFCDEDLPTTMASCRAMDGKFLRTRAVEDAVAILRDCNGILSMRLHALILSAVTSTPAIGISIDPNDRKIASFARLAGQDAISYPRPSVGEIVELLEHQKSSVRSQNAACIEQAVEEMQKKAIKDLENIVKILYNKGDERRS